MRLMVLLLAVLVAAVCPASAAPQVIFSSDFPSASPYNFPGAGGGEFRTSGDTYVVLTQFTSGGPGNRAYIRSTNVVTATPGIQPYAGWARTGLSSVSNGTSRFLRGRLRVA